MEDVIKKRFDGRCDERLVEVANEENEWFARLEELSKAKPEKKKKPLPPRRARKFQRVSIRQQNAIGRR